jgi:hypothetical protein
LGRNARRKHRGLPAEEYFPLLYILKHDMTGRAASSIVGMLLGKNYMDIYHDSMRVNDKTLLPDAEIVAQLKQRLLDCGYEKWLDE